jgi:hypothetical protein
LEPRKVTECVYCSGDIPEGEIVHRTHEGRYVHSDSNCFLSYVDREDKRRLAEEERDRLALVAEIDRLYATLCDRISDYSI